MRVLRWWLFLIFAFYLCGVLTVIPLPEPLEWYRPQWLLMLIIFAQIMYPPLFNPLIAWVIGLLLDTLLGTRLGEHALVFAGICYISAFLRPKFIQRPLWQQIGKIFLLVCLGQIIILWFRVFAGQYPHTLMYWMSSLTSCLMWPFFVLLLQSLTKLFSVAPYRTRSL